MLLHLAACSTTRTPVPQPLPSTSTRRTSRAKGGRGDEAQTAKIFRVMADLPVMVLQRWFHVDHFEVLSRLDYHPLRKSRGESFA